MQNKISAPQEVSSRVWLAAAVAGQVDSRTGGREGGIGESLASRSRLRESLCHQGLSEIDFHPIAETSES